METDRYGLQIGDFNGDGRSDIAYSGRCGASLPCTRVHVSTGTGFTAQNWGDNSYVDGPITAHFGMRVGDRDDIGYRGRCGNSVPQWRYYMGAASGPFTMSCSPSNGF